MALEFREFPEFAGYVFSISRELIETGLGESRMSLSTQVGTQVGTQVETQR